MDPVIVVPVSAIAFIGDDRGNPDSLVADTIHYGPETQTLAEQLGCTLPEAEKLIIEALMTYEIVGQS